MHVSLAVFVWIWLGFKAVWLAPDRKPKNLFGQKVLFSVLAWDHWFGYVREPRKKSSQRMKRRCLVSTAIYGRPGPKFHGIKALRFESFLVFSASFGESVFC